jgi:hypothetical protein
MMRPYAVSYDLGRAPASWDFLNWLINVEIERRLHNGGPLTVRFVPGPKDGFRDDNLARPTDQRRAILENVMKPALRLIGATEGNEDNAPSPSYMITSTVEYANRGIVIPKFQAPDEYLQEADEWLGGSLPVVITLREAAYYPERNSNIPNWIKFARGIGVPVVFVRDTRMAGVPLEDFPTDFVPGNPIAMNVRASTDLLFRAALMQRARVNMMVSNGPIGIAQHIENPWLQFKPMTPQLPGWSPGQASWWEKIGIGVGGQYPWTKEDQRICWGDDELHILETAWCGINGLPDPHPLKPLGQIIAKGATNDDQRFEHTKINITKVKDRLPVIGPHQGTAIVACYGPSLQHTWKLIRHERNLIPGAQIVSVSGAHDFLIGNRIKPNFHIDCDPRPHKHLMTTKLNRKTHYMIASCVHPSYIDKLKGHHVSLWHLCNGDESQRILDELEPQQHLIGGGGSAGLRAICVMHSMGFRKFIIHGMDCSFSEDDVPAQHAGPHDGKTQAVIRVKAGDRFFNTSAVLVSYAQQFLDMLNLMMKAPNPLDRPAFDLHGDGLLQHYLRLSVQADLKRKIERQQANERHGHHGPGSIDHGAAGAVLPFGG